MPDRPDAIQLLITDHRIDYQRAAHLACPGQCVLVEMLPESERLGKLFLPPRVSANLRPDLGIVLSSGPDAAIEPGAMVAVRGYDGQWIEGFEVPGYQTSNQVRVLGKFTHFEGETQAMAWDESILCRIFPEDLTMQAVGRNLIIRRDPQVREQGGVLLPDLERYHTGMATVESIGPQCELETRLGPVRVGDRVHYDTRAVTYYEFGDGVEDLAILPDIGIDFVVYG